MDVLVCLDWEWNGAVVEVVCDFLIRIREILADGKDLDGRDSGK